MKQISSKKLGVISDGEYKKKVRLEGRKFCFKEVSPLDIQIREDGGAGRFGKAEVEHAAADLIKFFKTKGTWEPFYMEELLQFYKKNGLNKKRILFGLICPWEDDGVPFFKLRIRSYKKPHIVSLADGRFAVTSQFIECLQSN